MKFAICNEMYENWPFEKVCDFVAAAGYQGVEIAPFVFAPNVFDIRSEQRKKIAKTAEKSGLGITGLHWLLAKTEGCHLTNPNTEVQKRTVAYFQELIRFCAEIGGTIMVLGSPKQRNLLPNVTKKTAMKIATETLQQLVPLLESTGVVIALEALAPEETNFLDSVAEAFELKKKVSAPEQISIMLDCKAMCGSEKNPIPEVIRKYRGEFVHFHVNDPNLQGPGFGSLDFQPIFAALNEINYSGWVSVEAFDYSPGVERLTIESLAYMKETSCP